MNFFVRIVCCCFVIISLTSCVSSEQTACKIVCQQRLQVCTQSCHNNCPECCLVANQRAARDYRHYQHQQNIQGQNVVRRLNSYRDPLQCHKTTCECPTDYRICIQSCTGKMPKRLIEAPVC